MLFTVRPCPLCLPQPLLWPWRPGSGHGSHVGGGGSGQGGSRRGGGSGQGGSRRSGGGGTGKPYCTSDNTVCRHTRNVLMCA